MKGITRLHLMHILLYHNLITKYRRGIAKMKMAVVLEHPGSQCLFLSHVNHHGKDGKIALPIKCVAGMVRVSPGCDQSSINVHGCDQSSINVHGCEKSSINVPLPASDATLYTNANTDVSWSLLYSHYSG